MRRRRKFATKLEAHSSGKGLNIARRVHRSFAALRMTITLRMTI